MIRFSNFVVGGILLTRFTLISCPIPFIPWFLLHFFCLSYWVIYHQSGFVYIYELMIGVVKKFLATFFQCDEWWNCPDQTRQRNKQNIRCPSEVGSLFICPLFAFWRSNPSRIFFELKINMCDIWRNGVPSFHFHHKTLRFIAAPL